MMRVCFGRGLTKDITLTKTRPFSLSFSSISTTPTNPPPRSSTHETCQNKVVVFLFFLIVFVSTPFNSFFVINVDLTLLSTQVLAKEPGSENRKNCAQYIVPLIDSVDDLNAYASSPEFAAVPAKISEEVK